MHSSPPSFKSLFSLPGSAPDIISAPYSMSHSASRQSARASTQSSSGVRNASRISRRKPAALSICCSANACSEALEQSYKYFRGGNEFIGPRFVTANLAAAAPRTSSRKYTYMDARRLHYGGVDVHRETAAKHPLRCGDGSQNQRDS